MADAGVGRQDQPVLLAHAAATLFLAGLAWVVQLVVYPGFREVGDTWPAFHAAHERAMARVVTLPWAVQGVTTAALLVLHDQPWWLLLPDALAAATTVAVTVTVSVPLHRGLATYDRGKVDRLVATNWWRTAAWSLSAVLTVVMIGT